MSIISVTYTPKFQVSFAPNYQWTDCGKCFNSKTGRRIKQVYNNGSIGYNIKGKFCSLKRLRKELELIPKENNLPF